MKDTLILDVIGRLNTLQGMEEATANLIEKNGYFETIMSRDSLYCMSSMQHFQRFINIIDTRRQDDGRINVRFRYIEEPEQ